MALSEGMDTGRVREIAGQLTTQSGKVGEIAANGSTQTGTLAENWLGPDSDQFKSSWEDASRALQQAQDALDTYAKRAMQEADQQDQASGGGGGA